MTPEDEALVRAQRLDALQRALGAHDEEGRALRDLQAVVGARDRDLLREVRRREWEAEAERSRRKMRRYDMILYVLFTLAVIGIWVEAFLFGRFGHPH
jgi:hypothetical protein